MDSAILKIQSRVQKEENIHFQDSSEIISFSFRNVFWISCRQKNIGNIPHCQNAMVCKLGSGRDSTISTYWESLIEEPLVDSTGVVVDLPRCLHLEGGRAINEFSCTACHHDALRNLWAPLDLSIDMVIFQEMRGERHTPPSVPLMCSVHNCMSGAGVHDLVCGQAPTRKGWFQTLMRLTEDSFAIPIPVASKLIGVNLYCWKSVPDED